MEQKRLSLNVVDHIRRSVDRFADCNKNLGDPLSFGIQYLDDCLSGIFQEDLVILTAKSGIGKTEAAKICAFSNAKEKRVHFFALEGSNSEIERRMKYSMIAECVFGSMKNEFAELFPNEHFNYTDWLRGKFDSFSKKVEPEIEELFRSKCPGLFTSYSTEINENNVEELILGIKNQTDLIILDHLHYFDFEDENENRAMKSLVKKLKQVSETSRKPIVLLAHVKKSDRRFASLVPTIDDVHGSSDIVKIATKMISIAPANTDSDNPYLFPTFFKAEKNRHDSSRTRFVGMTNYDVKTNNYEREYVIGKISADGKEFEAIERSKWPYWAGGHKKASAVHAAKNYGGERVERYVLGRDD